MLLFFLFYYGYFFCYDIFNGYEVINGLFKRGVGKKIDLDYWGVDNVGNKFAKGYFSFFCG